MAADATQLPFLDRTFDAVLAHSVLESGVEPAKLLAEALAGAAAVRHPGEWHRWSTAGSSWRVPRSSSSVAPTTSANRSGCTPGLTHSSGGSCGGCSGRPGL